jgi:hypothetical protein
VGRKSGGGSGSNEHQGEEIILEELVRVSSVDTVGDCYKDEL